MKPHRKHLGVEVACRSLESIAVECVWNPSTRPYLVKLVSKEVRKEIQSIASESFLSGQSKEAFMEFRWDRLHAELFSKAPVFLSILTEATKTRVSRSNWHIIICTCVSILLKHRNPKISLLHKIISLVLYAGHAYKQVLYLLISQKGHFGYKIALCRCMDIFRNSTCQ